MRSFSKSKLIALKQCQKRFWLEVHRPELKEFSSQAENGFQTGYSVGDIAHKIYDPLSTGTEIDVSKLGFPLAFSRTLELLTKAKPIFEAGFSANGGLAFADVMLPDLSKKTLYWHMIEIKSSTSIKDYHRDDVAIQAYLAHENGVKLSTISVAHIDNSWIYQGDGSYMGLLIEKDLTQEARSRRGEVIEWIAKAKRIADHAEEPIVSVGEQCNDPFECSFISYCHKEVVKTEYPISWLPRFAKEKISALANEGITDMRELSDDLIKDRQLLVKKHTLENSVFFDAQGAVNDLKDYALPIQFLDFETCQFVIPIWAGTSPYQAIPFQYSLHKINEDGELSHLDFLDLSGDDPSRQFTISLIENCGNNFEPIFVYSKGFEMGRINELAIRFPEFKDALEAINKRIVDLLPIARNRYYHPSQEGSWSIKKVLPAVVPDLKYSDLNGIKDGGMAMEGFSEAIHTSTSFVRHLEIKDELLAYCKLDTYAMVRLWQVFSGRNELKL